MHNLKIVDGKVYLDGIQIQGVHTYQVNFTCFDGRPRAGLTLSLHINPKVNISRSGPKLKRPFSATERPSGKEKTGK